MAADLGLANVECRVAQPNMDNGKTDKPGSGGNAFA